MNELLLITISRLHSRPAPDQLYQDFQIEEDCEGIDGSSGVRRYLQILGPQSRILARKSNPSGRSLARPNSRDTRGVWGNLAKRVSDFGKIVRAFSD